MKAVLLVFFCIPFLFSCSPKLAPDSNWAEGKWILIELKEVPVQLSGINSRNAHIEFIPSSKSYQGFGGCNRIGGTYTINKKKIKFSSTNVRPDDCPDMPFETAFVSQLGDAETFSVSGNFMTLKKGNKIILKLERKL